MPEEHNTEPSDARTNDAGQIDSEETRRPRVDRRGMMFGAAAAGAGLAAGIVSGADPAGAATPSVKLGADNKETTVTSIKNTTGPAFQAQTNSTASGVAAIEGIVNPTSPGGYSAGVYGQNNGTGGSGIGVYGAQNGFGWGVYGTTPSGSGVYGYSSSGYGVQAGSSSGTGIYASSTGGVGVDGHSSSNIAVAGTSGSSTGVQGSSSSGYGVYGASPNNYAVVGVTTSGNGVYGQVATANQAGIVGRQLASSGNWAIYGFGNIGATGTKSAVVPINKGAEHVTLYCVESPECWFEDFGFAQLSSGTVTVTIDPVFAQTIDTDSKYFVFLQPEGDCKGLYVSDKTPTGFTVTELHAGTSDAAFAFRLVGLRQDVTAPRLHPATLPDVKPIS